MASLTEAQVIMTLLTALRAKWKELHDGYISYGLGNARWW